MTIPLPSSAGAMNRRQPARQARSNHARNRAHDSTSTTTPLGNETKRKSRGVPAMEHRIDQDVVPSYCSAITYFTDAITALPKEMIRHYTMLKEVDAKVYGPQDRLAVLLKASMSAGNLAHGTTAIPSAQDGDDTTDFNANPPPSKVDSQFQRRRRQFWEIRQELARLLMTLDEKNHVLNTAVDELGRQLRRCRSVMPDVEEEFSDEARLGSMTHWAYAPDDVVEKKAMMDGDRERERSRRVNHMSAAGAEAAQEALVAGARKGRGQHAARDYNIAESDLDDLLGTSARQSGAGGKKSSQLSNAKARKAAEAALANGANGTGNASGIVSSGSHPKKRKLEKVPSRNLEGIHWDKNAGRGVHSHGHDHAHAQAHAHDRIHEPSTIDTTAKKRSRGGASLAAQAAANGRKRSSNHAASHLAPAPHLGTFTATSKDRRSSSMNPRTLQRTPSYRKEKFTSHDISAQHHDHHYQAQAQQQNQRQPQQRQNTHQQQATNPHRNSATGSTSSRIRSGLTNSIAAEGDGPFLEDEAHSFTLDQENGYGPGRADAQSYSKDENPLDHVSDHGILASGHMNFHNGSRAASVMHEMDLTKANDMHEMDGTMNFMNDPSLAGDQHQALPRTSNDYEQVCSHSRSQSVKDGARSMGHQVATAHSARDRSSKSSSKAATPQTATIDIDGHMARGHVHGNGSGNDLEPHANASMYAASSSQRPSSRSAENQIHSDLTPMGFGTAKRGPKKTSANNASHRDIGPGHPNTHSVAGNGIHKRNNPPPSRARQRPRKPQNQAQNSTILSKADVQYGENNPNQATQYLNGIGTNDDGNIEGSADIEVDVEEEPRYCYCNDFSYGEMVGCDADDCQREWFHLDCVGLARAPSKSAKWYCDDCRENLKRR